MEQLTSRQLARKAKESLDKYLNTGDLDHLKKAKQLVSQAQLEGITDSNYLNWK